MLGRRDGSEILGDEFVKLTRMSPVDNSELFTRLAITLGQRRLELCSCDCIVAECTHRTPSPRELRNPSEYLGAGFWRFISSLGAALSPSRMVVLKCRRQELNLHAQLRALGPEPSASSFRACWTRVGFSLHVEKEQPHTQDSCGIHIVSVLLPYCQSCSQFAPNQPEEACEYANGVMRHRNRLIT